MPIPDCTNRYTFSKQNKKFLEKNIGEYLHGLGVGKYLKTQKSLTIKETVINWTTLNFLKKYSFIYFGCAGS